MNKKNNQSNNQPVPQKDEIKNKSNNRNATGVVLQHQSAYQYQGPIPPPEMMEKYKNIYSTVFEPFSEEHSLLPQHDVIGESRRVEKKCKMCIYSSKQNFDFEGLCKGLLDSPLRIRIS